MLAVSAEWPKLSPRVFARIEQQAVGASGDKELALLVRTHANAASFFAHGADASGPQKLRRTLGEVDSEIKAFAALFDEFLGAIPEEWEALLGLRRAAVTPLFFEYLQLRISALSDDKQELREGAWTRALQPRQFLTLCRPQSWLRLRLGCLRWSTRMMRQ